MLTLELPVVSALSAIFESADVDACVLYIRISISVRVNPCVRVHTLYINIHINTYIMLTLELPVVSALSAIFESADVDACVLYSYI